MLEGRIIMLGSVGAGTVLGALFALTVPTAMKPGPEPTWRDTLPQPRFSSESYRFVEAGPIDAGPRRWLEPPVPEPVPAYTVPDYADEPEAAEAADLVEVSLQDEVAPAVPQEPETPLVEIQPAAVITMPEELATTL